MNTIILYSFVAGFSLLAGALVGLIFKFKQKIIAAFMAFGSGVLICALTFGLMEEAFKHGGFDAVILGFLGGGIVFILGDYLLHLTGGRRHKRRQFLASADQSNGKVITLGAILDGIPESIALGISLFTGGGKGLLLLVAIVLTNFPESISSLPGLQKEGFSRGKIYLMWAIVGTLSALIAIGSFVFLHDINPNTIGILEAFAAGAILAMLADTMMPEAYEEGGFTIGLVTVFGFLIAFVLSRY